MINILEKLRLLSLNSKSTESLIEVIDVLTTLRDSATELSAYLEGDDDPFNTSILALSPRHRVVVIASPPPEIHMPGNPQGRRISLSTSSSGREISFQSRLTEPFLPIPDMGYQIEMPHFLGTEQPRGAFRVLLDELRYRVGITLMDSADHQIEGVVKNISRSGIGMKTNNFLPDAINGAMEKVNCSIALENSEQISCKMEIRNVQQKSNGEHSTYVGGRMTDISPYDENRLTRFIQQLQQQKLQALIS